MSVINTKEFFQYITYLNQTFKTRETRVQRYNGSYQIILDTFYKDNKFGGDPLIYTLLLRYRDRELARAELQRDAS